MGFLDTAKIKAVDLLQQIYEYMNEKYGMSSAVFTPASPMGMIIGALANIAELIFVYLEHVATEMNILRAVTPASVYGLARLSGHDPFRGSAAKGMITLKINPSSTDYTGYVKILNGTEISVDSNSVGYFIKLDSEYAVLTLNGEPVTASIVQGSEMTQKFTGDGTKLQSYNVNEKSMTDQDLVNVYVNGERWERRESLYDMPYESHTYMVKTSVTGGLTLFFGNGDFGHAPESGANIEIRYVTHIGEAGNVAVSNPSYTFNTNGYDELGETVDLNKVVSIQTDLAPTMGANNESLDMTRLIAPHMSKAFVLATPENYITYLSRYQQFSFVNAYNTKDDGYIDDDNVVYLQILPNVKSKLPTGGDYFDLPLDEFTLKESDKEAIRTVIDNSGRQLISTELVIEDMVVRRYALFVLLKYFAGSDKNIIRSTIRERLNNYFLNINRNDILPKSDLISMIEGVEGVDSVNVYFVSERNEQAVRDGYYMQTEDRINPMTHLHEKTTRRVVLEPGEEPMLGLDAFGDIQTAPNEIAVIKGGWTDRYNNEYREDVADNQLCGLNIIFSNTTDAALYNITQQNTFNKILASINNR